jgi:hypothetical protein
MKSHSFPLNLLNATKIPGTNPMTSTHPGVITFPKRLIAVGVEDLRAAFHAFAGDESDLLRAGAPDLQRL